MAIPLTNVFTFANVAKTGKMLLAPRMVPHFLYPDGVRQWHIRCGVRQESCDVRISRDVPIYQAYADKAWLCEADLAKIRGHKRPHESAYEFVRRTQDVTLLFVSTSDYSFRTANGEPAPHFGASTIWIGAEGSGLCVQVGEYQSGYKRQIVRLMKDESILFFDANKEVTKITAQAAGQEPVLIRATEGEVADHILHVALTRGKGECKSASKTRGWCFYALQELGCRAQIDVFLKEFPNFAVDAK